MSKEKNKNKKWILIVVLTAAAVVLAAFMPALTAWARRTFSTSAEYYRYAEKKSAEKLISAFCEWYAGDFQKDSSEDSEEVHSAQRTFLFEMGEEFRKFAGTGIEKVGLDVETAAKRSGFASAVSGALSLNGMRILNAEALFDSEKSLIYSKLSEFSEKYLAVGSGNVFGTGSERKKMNETLAAMLQFYKFMPDEKTVRKFLDRYTALALSCIEEVEKKTGTVNAGSVSKECTELVINVDGAVLRKTAETVLAAMTEDKELKKLITEASASQDEEAAEITYREFCGRLKGLMDNLTVFDNAETFVMTVKVNNKGEIIGRSFVFEDGSGFSYAFPVDRKKIGCDVSVRTDGVKISFEGEGTRKKEWFSGEFKLKVMGFRIAEFRVEKLNLRDWQDGRLNGTITLAPAGMSRSILKEAAGENSSLFDDLGLIISGTGAEKEIKIVLENRGEKIVALTYKKTKGKREKILFPPEEQVIKAEDKEAVTAWLEETDKEAFFEKLEEEGVPPEWIQALHGRFLEYIRKRKAQGKF